MATKIEWAHETRNFQSGCTEARHEDGTMSKECVNCYARLMSARQEAMGTELYKGAARRVGGSAVWTGAFAWSLAKMQELFDDFLCGKYARKRVFLGSMTDLFHDDADKEMQQNLAQCIKFAWRVRLSELPRVIILTKRPANLLKWQQEYFPDGLPSWIWVGVTAGTQKSVDERLPILAQVFSHGVKVVSAEPLLEEIDLTPYLGERWIPVDADYPGEKFGLALSPTGLAAMIDGVRWVICGGESGSKARPSHPDWFRSLRDQCLNADVSYFHKQNGEWIARSQNVEGVVARGDDWGALARDGTFLRGTTTWNGRDEDSEEGEARMVRVGKKIAGRLLDGVEWSQVPNL